MLRRMSRGFALLLAAVAVVAAGPAPAGTRLEGRLEWAQRVVLGFAVSGVIAEVLVRPGQRVAPGALLARLDTRPFDARVRERAARVSALEPAFEEARREWKRAQELYERMVLSDRDRELVRIAYVKAESDLQAARAALERARIEREYAELRAPFDAMVLRVLGAPGQAQSAQLRVEPVIELARAGAMAAVVIVPDGRVPPAPGARAAVHAAGRVHAGRIVSVERIEGGWRVRVRFGFDGPGTLREGIPVTVELP